MKKLFLGVTLIGIFDIIGGLVFLAVGIGLFIVIPIISGNPDQFSIHPNSMSYKLLTTGPGNAFAVGVTIIGLASIIIGIGMLIGKQWAWKSAVVIAFISIAFNIIMMFVHTRTSNQASSSVSLIIDALILYYLYRPHVKMFFRKPAKPTPI